MSFKPKSSKNTDWSLSIAEDDFFEYVWNTFGLNRKRFLSMNFERTKENTNIVGICGISEDDGYKSNSLSFDSRNGIWKTVAGCGLIPLDMYISPNKQKEYKTRYNRGVSIHWNESPSNIYKKISKRNYFRIIVPGEYEKSLPEFIGNLTKLRYYIGIRNELFFLACYVLGENNCILASKDPDDIFSVKCYEAFEPKDLEKLEDILSGIHKRDLSF